MRDCVALVLTEPMDRLKLTLRENARDFLEDALANAVAAESHPKRWKFAVLSIVQSIELSLKELLSQVHPLLIYANIDKPTKTVTLDLAVWRLQNVTKLKLTKEDAEALALAKETRHQIVHHEVDANINELKLAFARLLGFLSDFYDSHFDSPLYYEIDEDLWKSGVAVRSYGQELYERAKNRINENKDPDYDEVISCPYCGWESMLVKEDAEGHCYVCGREENIVFCDRCADPVVAGEEHEEHGKKFCLPCLGYISSDYWYEQSVGK